MVVLHIVRQTLPNVPVIFLDTGYHFAEVYEYRDRMAREWYLNLINLLPEITVAEQESQFGILNQTDPSQCCGIRKVKPLFTALENYASGSPACAANKPKAAPPCNSPNPSSCPAATKSASQPTRRLDRKRRLGLRGSTTSPCSRSTRRATPASAASHVPACPSTPTIRAPAAGEARN